MNRILDAMGEIPIQFVELSKNYVNGVLSEESYHEMIDDLIVLNRGLLGSAGMSHPKISEIELLTAEHGLQSKLTGAGGGGVVLTFLKSLIYLTKTLLLMKLKELLNPSKREE
jgi:mevalonate kinase